MTTITTGPQGGGNDVTGSELQAVTSGTIGTHSATVFTVASSENIRFQGTGFTYSDGVPSGGTVTSLTVENGTTLDVKFAGLDVSFATLWSDMTSGNQAAFDTLLFSGDDTFTAGNTVANRVNEDDNHFDGFAGNDTFNMQRSSGFDTVSGGDGNDIINMGAMFRATDSIDGGTGTDTLNLTGSYGAGVVFGATTLTTVEKIELGNGFNYKFTTNDATVASGDTLTVDGSHLTGAHSLNFNGAAETDGSFVLTGGTGNDALVGGAINNTITGGPGADKLTGGAGSDTFVYNSQSDSPGSANGGGAGHGYDTIVGFNASLDKIQTWHALSGIDAIASGSVSTATFDTNMGNILTAAHLDPYHAVLVKVTGGTLVHDLFLIVDMNGIAGYQSGADLVIHLAGATNLSHMGTDGDFIT